MSATLVDMLPDNLPNVACEELSAEVQAKVAKSHGLTKRWIDLLPVEPTENLADIITENIHSAVSKLNFLLC